MAFNYKDFTASEALKEAERRKKKYDADYTESQKVQGLYNEWLNQKNNKPAEWTGGTYGTQVNEALNNILNRKKFEYDPNGDMLYKQYKDRYIQQGKQAMMDTIGQAAALTGGYDNSYAQTVGQQTYQGYLQGLNDKLPELYGLAMQKYQQEGDALKDKYGLLKGEQEAEYGKYRDNVADWQNALQMAYQIYNNERGNEQGQYNANRGFANDAYNSLYGREYAQYADNRNIELANYQAAQEAYQRSLDRAASSSGGGGGNEEEKPFEQWIYKGVEKDKKGNPTGRRLFYNKESGKTEAFDEGLVPYTGRASKDYKKGETFSNGYQPNNVGGDKLTSTGNKAVFFNGIEQTVYSTGNGKNKQYWVWNGQYGEYFPLSKEKYNQLFGTK